jgi:nucleoside-diphosphate-sugar epimerase
LTRERIKVVGLEEYIRVNRRITALVDSLLQANPNIPAITTSSGAAAVINENRVSLVDDPYGVLKTEEEQVWKVNAKDRLSIVFRVYAASGRFMKEPRLFALGDFIAQAISGQRLIVKSGHTVLRSYVNVGCLMRLCWSILLSPAGTGFAQIDACTHSLSLHDLAGLISRMWGLRPPYANIDLEACPDQYTADATAFMELLNQYNLALPSFEDQIRETSLDMH